jgi:alpha,alpha-trehalase
MRSKAFLLFLLTLTLSLNTACRRAALERPVVDDKAHLPPDERFGELFVAVQMGQVFPDGKTFVDCVPRRHTGEIMTAYAKAKDAPGFDLRAFVLDHFEPPKSFATGFVSDASRDAVEHINALWPALIRQPDTAAAGSLIPLPYPYVVPGGRFGEIYYWDSYFTMLGLRAAGRDNLVRNMVDNFAYLIDTIGFIPNGNRSYYLSRSQPPFFAAMVDLLARAGDEEATLARYLPQLRKEYEFWMAGREELRPERPALKKVVRLPDGKVLNRYWDARDTPRPESYREDVETAERAQRPAAEVYRHLRSAAESGWDFSSRWLRDPQNLASIHTADIIPVDLNALLFFLEVTLGRAYEAGGDTEAAANLRGLARQRRDALLEYCWSENEGYFMDYDFVERRHTPVLSLAGLFPLYFKVLRDDDRRAAQIAAKVEAVFLQAGGLTTTTSHTGQQWDAPNGWAPLQWIAIEGLRHYGFDQLAARVKQRWVDSNLRVYRNTGKMVEKYNVFDLELEAGGGEYPVQDGFGWTNGVLLRLLTETER